MQEHEQDIGFPEALIANEAIEQKKLGVDIDSAYIRGGRRGYALGFEKGGGHLFSARVALPLLEKELAEARAEICALQGAEVKKEIDPLVHKALQVELEVSQRKIEHLNKSISSLECIIGDKQNQIFSFIRLENTQLIKALDEIRSLKEKLDEKDEMTMDQVMRDLDGAALVNLEEPSPGDLKRISDAYHKERAKTKALVKEVERLKEFEWMYKELEK